MTLYRRFPDIHGMLSALMTREFGGVIAAASEAASTQPTARDRIVTSAVHAVHALHENKLMRTVLERDAEMMVPYIMERVGTSQRMVEGYLKAQFAEGHEDGSIRGGDLDVQARSFFLLLQPYAIALRPSTSDIGIDALLDELSRVLDVVLRP
jgi:AcrR family transcriptional regulator